MNHCDAHAKAPELGVWRPGHNQWMIAGTRQSRVPVADLLGSSLLIHQDHEYFDDFDWLNLLCRAMPTPPRS